MSVERTIWEFFKSKGLNDYGVAGLMGNLFAESGLKPKNMQNSYEKKLNYTDDTYTAAVDNGTYTNFVRDSVGYGLAQWTFWSRKQNLLNYAKNTKRSIGDLNMQLEFLYNELSTNVGYKSVLKVLQSATSVLQASNAVLLNYEKPANQGISVQAKRAEYGERYYKQFVVQEKEPTIKRGKVVNVHAGHNPDGKVACGAVGFLKESTEARKLKEKVIGLLREKRHTVYDCTVDDGVSQSDVLKKIVAKCNAHTVDLDISIHFNAGVKDTAGNKRTTGVECLVYSLKSKSVPYAEKICESISQIGFTNRGVKVRPELYVLKKTKAPAIIVEVCFVDDKDDYMMYDVDEVAQAIVNSI